MSYPGGGFGEPYGAFGPGEQERYVAQRGSVRAARERAQAQQAKKTQWTRGQQDTERSTRPPPAPERPYQLASHNNAGRGHLSVPDRPHVFPPDPAQQQQWPLRFDDTPIAAPRAIPPPQNVRHLLHARQVPIAIQSPTSFDPSRDTAYRGQVHPADARYWQDDGYQTASHDLPYTARPLTDSSRAPNSYTVDPVPQFPLHVVQPSHARRQQQFTSPPPTARRGPSSYYPQTSHVPPIAEEPSARGSVGSFASSNVFPVDPPDFFIEDDSEEEEEEEEEEESNVGAAYEVPGTQEEDLNSLARTASLGQHNKPVLVTTPSEPTSRLDTHSNAYHATQSEEALSRKVARFQVASPLAASSVLFDPSSSSSEESLQLSPVQSDDALSDYLKNKARSSIELMSGNKSDSNSPKVPATQTAFNRTAPMSPLVPDLARVDHILGGLEKGGAIGPGTPKEFREAQRRGTLADRVGARRPSRLNVDAVRDAEARGSLTSLPDLIRRATRLAANLDRGKTASRLGFEWLDGGEYEKWNYLNEFGSDDFVPGDAQRRTKKRRSITLSGMLSAFPPPGASSLDSPRTAWPNSRGKSSRGLASGRHGSRRKTHQEKRRCCGLPLCAFILLVLFLIVLVAAAIVIPVVLIVLPNRVAVGPSGTTSFCQKKAPCENGGSSAVMMDGSCGCLCTNGFTGPHCQNPSDGGCSTQSIGGVKNASLGSQIPPLLEAAASKYSIPLDGFVLLSLFAATNMTCGAENALVTLTGNSALKRSPATLNASLRNHARAEPSRPAITSNGIQLDGGLQPTKVAPAQASSTSAVVVATGSPAPGTNSTSKDFARVGVLFVLQESRQLSIAIKAQEQLSNYMNQATKQGSTIALARNVTLGSSYFIDLWYYTVTLSNGTIYGNGFNGTAIALPRVNP